MRRALNENPLVQALLIGALALVVGVLLLTRVLNQGEAEPEGPTTPATSAAAPLPSAAEDAAAASPATAAEPGSAELPPAADAVPDAGGATADGFVAGPGLPAEVVRAYAQGKVVAVLVVRRKGIDDRLLRARVDKLRARNDTAVFVTPAKGIAKYSRITQGVDLDRVPALVVLRPRRLADGPLPSAAVSYGYRGPGSVTQAIRDALYKGRDNLPYHPR